jgi:membrane-associated phospholipid phosphatase
MSIKAITHLLGAPACRGLRRACATLVLATLPLLGQEPAPPEPKAEKLEKPAEPPKTALGVPKLLLDDTLFIITAPARWERNDWLQTGQGLAVVVGTALLLDTRVRDESQRLRSPGSDKVAKQIQNFGTSYAFGVIGGFWVYGKLASDAEAVHTGLDAAEASLIAGAIVGPLLKTALGRSRPSEQQGAFHFRPFGGGVSAPSGHTTEAFALAEVISEHYAQPWVHWFTFGIATLVGVSRIEQNAHFASDVVSGALLGTLVGRTIVRRNQERRGGPSKLEVSLEPDFGTGYQGVSLALRF